VGRGFDQSLECFAEPHNALCPATRYDVVTSYGMQTRRMIFDNTPFKYDF